TGPGGEPCQRVHADGQARRGGDARTRCGASARCVLDHSVLRPRDRPADVGLGAPRPRRPVPLCAVCRCRCSSSSTCRCSWGSQATRSRSSARPGSPCRTCSPGKPRRRHRTTRSGLACGMWPALSTSDGRRGRRGSSRRERMTDERFPLGGPRGSVHTPTAAADGDLGSAKLGPQSAQTADTPAPPSPLPSGSSPGRVGARDGRSTAPAASYVELHAHSAYSFLDGASLPEELAARAAQLGYDALALTDHDGVYGSLEFAHACKHFGVRAITGAEVSLAGGAHVTLLCENRRGYANLCRILTDAHARTRLPGRERELLPAATTLDVVAAHADGLVCLSGCARSASSIRTVPPTSPAHSRARSSSSCNGRSRAATRAGTRRSKSSLQRSAFPPSRPATCMRITSVALACRTCSSRSVTGRISTV